MDPLKKHGVRTLADLTNFDKVNGLFPLLAMLWQNVLLFDDTIKPETLTASQKEFLKDADNVRFWEGLSNDKYREQKKRLLKIIAKHGAGTHEKVKNDIAEIWADTCKNSPELTMWQHTENSNFSPGIDHVAKCPENQNSPELIIKLKGQNRGTCTQPPREPLPIEPEKKCEVCGKDMTGKRRDAKTCCKKCRNAKSNPVNHIKDKLKTLESRGLLFDIRPYLQPKQLPLAKHLP